jgi:hypothetical protein
MPKKVVANIYSGSQKSEVCPMPYDLCRIVPHLSEKGYSSNIKFSQLDDEEDLSNH